ncbi:transposase [Streptomyces sp. NPDC056159]|uniref:IS110 family transposase n=1 Tax=unclassified Streptomyces TaxID=2593676 RepID=UPI0034485F7A
MLNIIGTIASPLTAMLLAEGPHCVHVPGLAVNRARRGTRGGENKSDPRDAQTIAEQVLLRDDLRVVDLLDEQAVELRLLVSHRTTLVKEATARTSRLRDLPAGVHPGLERAVDPTGKVRYSRSATGGDKALTRVFNQASVLYAMLRDRQPFQARPPLRLVA